MIAVPKIPKEKSFGSKLAAIVPALLIAMFFYAGIAIAAQTLPTATGKSAAVQKKDKAKAAKRSFSQKAVKKKTTKKKSGISKDRVMKLQESLNKAGGNLKVDGLMGEKTKAALVQYQKRNGLNASGKADAATLKAMAVN